MEKPFPTSEFLPKPLDGKPLNPIPVRAKDHVFKQAQKDAERFGLKPEPMNVFRSLSDWACEFLGYYGSIFRSQYMPPKRGILIYGARGSGKTKLSRFFFDVINGNTGSEEKKIRYAHCYDVVDTVSANADKYLQWYQEQYQYKHCVFDDLGPEGNPQCFGMPFGMREILTRRYDEWVERGTLTIVTTNLDGPEQIAERYGDRVADRFNEMFDFVLCNRESQRTNQ